MCCNATGTELLVAELAVAFCSGFGHIYDGICTMRIWTGYGLVVTVATEAAASVIDGGMGLAPLKPQDHAMPLFGCQIGLSNVCIVFLL